MVVSYVCHALVCPKRNVRMSFSGRVILYVASPRGDVYITTLIAFGSARCVSRQRRSDFYDPWFLLALLYARCARHATVYEVRRLMEVYQLATEVKIKKKI